MSNRRPENEAFFLASISLCAARLQQEEAGFFLFSRCTAPLDIERSILPLYSQGLKREAFLLPVPRTETRNAPFVQAGAGQRNFLHSIGLPPYCLGPK